jgi:hypothetical protein
MRTLIVSSLLLIMGTGLAHAGLVLTPASGDITGSAGSTVGWGFLLTTDLEWLSAVSSETLLDSNPGLGTYLDFIGSSGGLVNGVTAPSSSWNQLFDASAGDGVGAFVIDSAAHTGDTDSGLMEILFESFSQDPNICSTCATGFVTIDLPFSVRVVAPVNTTPEPATWLLFVGSLLAGAAAKLQRRSSQQS